MKFALFLVLALSAVAFAGPAFNKNNQIQQQQQDAINNKQQQYMTINAGEEAKSPAVQALKQWCFASQMSQQELTASFKKLVSVIKSNPSDQITESAVMGERICQGALVAKSQVSGETVSQGAADAKAHELIKDVYMDAMISCKSHECTQQLLKTIGSSEVDSIRASYYMTRMAVTDAQEIKDEQEVKQFAESFLSQISKQQHQSEAVERQQLFATTSLIGKWINSQQQQQSQQSQEISQVAEQVAKAIVERYIKRVSQQEVEQFKQAEQGELSPELAKKIAKRSAALKALANIPGHVIKQCGPQVESVLVEIAQNKAELSTARQSAIECLEQNDKQVETLKELVFAQEEPIEVRVAAYRALMTSMFAPESQQEQKTKEQKEKMAEEIISEIVKHCEQKQQQQQDDQFVLYAVSHLDNLRSSQQPEVAAIKEAIAANKQHYMQIQLLAKKLAKQLADVRRSSRNYKLEQAFAQLESGLILEGDIIYESQEKKIATFDVLPKLVRVNMSMPVMGETVNVVEITLRQDNMDQELLGALKMIQNTKFSQETVSKVVDSFKQTAERQQQQQSIKKTDGKQAQADLTIKVDGRCVVYMSLDDFKCTTTTDKKTTHQRNTRSIYSSSNSIVDEIVEYLKRSPVSFNRGFNFNIQERIAKVLDVDVNVLAGLRFESRAQGSSKKDFEIVAQMEPRFAFEAISGPAKLTSKKLLQRLSSKTALGLRLRFKESELVDVELELPLATQELFTFESQLVEKSTRAGAQEHSYEFLPESIYGQEDIYASYPIYSSAEFERATAAKFMAKRSIVPTFSGSNKKTTTSGIYGKLIKSITGNQKSAAFSHSFETSKRFARATGLVGKLRVVASPKDMSLLVSALVEKHEQQMRGFRVKLEQQGGRTSSDLKTYQLSIMTPGSTIDRSMQIRLTKQSSQARTLVKSEIQSAAGHLSAGFTCELVHDGRQYSMKTELVSRSNKQWRHAMELGLQQGPSASTSGRLAHFNYKPYLQVDSTSLARPLAMQGQLAYVQSPKSVISYELKCPTTGDFLQGKLIFDARDNKMSAQMRKRSSTSFRRSMQSPLELIASQDLTLTSEFLAQLGQGKHAIKAHQMIDWDCQKLALQGNSQVSHKNLRKQTTDEIVAEMKVDAEQQLFSVARKCPEEARKSWTVRVNSQARPTGHHMEAECRYNHSRRGPAVLAYKHKMEVAKVAANKYECALELELVDSARSLNEKAAGRVRISNERKQKQCQLELANGSRAKLAKVNVDFESLAKHTIAVVVASERFAHKCEMRNNERQFVLSSRTEKPHTKEMLAKLMVEVDKQQQQQQQQTKIVFELSQKRVQLAADLQPLDSGKRSSLALQSPRFASQIEFTLDTKDMNKRGLRFRSNLKDLVNKQAYWMESQVNAGDRQQESFLRFDSPYYRSELEFSPRDQEAKFAAFARQQRPKNQFESIYRFNAEQQDGEQKSASLIEQLGSLAQEKLSLGPSKMWMLRSIVSSPFARDQIKQQARRALFEYADRRQAHKHSLNWSPEDERINMQFVREPNTEFASKSSFEPLRLKADISTEIVRPSTVQLESQWMDVEAEAKPFGHFATDADQTQDSYAKVSALSRNTRSVPFKKHESELRYNKKSGYKAHMKHEDSRAKRHELRAEADASPAKWAKLAYESDKHGKTNWEHKWRQGQAKKRSAVDQEEIFENKMWLKREGPQANKWAHETTFEWEEPARMERRYRRSIYGAEEEQQKQSIFSSYPIEYLKATNGRLVSSYTDDVERTATSGAANNYQLDFDYKPRANMASLAFEMPQDMSHFSQVEIKPAERLYKLQSKLYNRRSQKPTYELLAATKQQQQEQIEKLATGEQEPVFVHSSHPMLERPISRDSLLFQLFKQPMKLDYSDKYGRRAAFDYDALVDAARQQQEQTFAGLRQKRAIVSYSDPMADIEHSSTFDFYPETTLFGGKINKSYKQQHQQQQQQMMMMAPVALKTHTKYGPIVVRADSTDSALLLDMESPLVRAKLVGETGPNMRTLYKVQLDNKSQRVQLAKLIRDIAPEMVRDCHLVKKFARKFDSIKFEQQAEMLVSIVDQIFKVKSSTKVDERQVVVIEGEWNQATGKAFAKIDGERVEGQAIVDLVRKTAELTLSADDKRTLHHVTRLVKVSDKFYSLESMTSHKSRPVFKLAGQVSAKIFDLEHLLETSNYESRRHTGAAYDQAEHLSTFEAVVYEPKELHVVGQFDCDKKEARIVIKNLEEQRVQETLVRFDQPSETVLVSSELKSAHEGQIYATKAKIALKGLFQSEECKFNSNSNKYNKYFSNDKYATMKKSQKFINTNANTCQSEVVYSDNKTAGVWAAKYQPGQFVEITSPRSGKNIFNLATVY